MARGAKWIVVVISLTSLGFAVFSSTTLVSLLLMGYAGVTQFFPGVAFGLFWPRATTAGVMAGLVSGAGLVAFFVLTGRDPFLGVNAGFVALLANFAVATIVSLASPAQPSGFETEA